MSNIDLYSEISALPPSLKKEVKAFVELLKQKNKSEAKVKERKFGCAKGLFTMKEDFDEPLGDFKEYM